MAGLETVSGGELSFPINFDTKQAVAAIDALSSKLNQVESRVNSIGNGFGKGLEQGFSRIKPPVITPKIVMPKIDPKFNLRSPEIKNFATQNAEAFQKAIPQISNFFREIGGGAAVMGMFSQNMGMFANQLNSVSFLFDKFSPLVTSAGSSISGFAVTAGTAAVALGGLALAVGGVSHQIGVFKEAMAAGEELESLQNQMGALINTTVKYKDTSNNAFVSSARNMELAFEQGKQLVAQFKKDAPALAGASLQELTQSATFSLAQIQQLGGGNYISIDKQAKLIESLTVATKTLTKGQANQLPSEIRALLSGRMDRRATLAMTLADASGGAKAFTAELAKMKKEGKAVEWLTQKLEPLRIAATFATKSMSNLREIVADFKFNFSTAVAGEGAFESWKLAVRGLYSAFVDFRDINPDEVIGKINERLASGAPEAKKYEKELTTLREKIKKGGLSSLTDEDRTLFVKAKVELPEDTFGALLPRAEELAKKIGKVWASIIDAIKPLMSIISEIWFQFLSFGGNLMSLLAPIIKSFSALGILIGGAIIAGFKSLNALLTGLAPVFNTILGAISNLLVVFAEWANKTGTINIALGLLLFKISPIVSLFYALGLALENKDKELSGVAKGVIALSVAMGAGYLATGRWVQGLLVLSAVMGTFINQSKSVEQSLDSFLKKRNEVNGQTIIDKESFLDTKERRAKSPTERIERSTQGVGREEAELTDFYAKIQESYGKAQEKTREGAEKTKVSLIDISKTTGEEIEKIESGSHKSRFAEAERYAEEVGNILDRANEKMKGGAELTAQELDAIWESGAMDWLSKIKFFTDALLANWEATLRYIFDATGIWISKISNKFVELMDNPYFQFVLKAAGVATAGLGAVMVGTGVGAPVGAGLIVGGAGLFGLGQIGENISKTESEEQKEQDKVQREKDIADRERKLKEDRAKLLTLSKNKTKTGGIPSNIVSESAGKNKGEDEEDKKAKKARETTEKNKEKLKDILEERKLKEELHKIEMALLGVEKEKQALEKADRIRETKRVGERLQAEDEQRNVGLEKKRVSAALNLGQINERQALDMNYQLDLKDAEISYQEELNDLKEEQNDIYDKLAERSQEAQRQVLEEKKLQEELAKATLEVADAEEKVKKAKDAAERSSAENELAKARNDEKSARDKLEETKVKNLLDLGVGTEGERQALIKVKTELTGAPEDLKVLKDVIKAKLGEGSAEYQAVVQLETKLGAAGAKQEDVKAGIGIDYGEKQAELNKQFTDEINAAGKGLFKDIFSAFKEGGDNVSEKLRSAFENFGNKILDTLTNKLVDSMFGGKGGGGFGLGGLGALFGGFGGGGDISKYFGTGEGQLQFSGRNKQSGELEYFNTKSDAMASSIENTISIAQNLGGTFKDLGTSCPIGALNSLGVSTQGLSSAFGSIGGMIGNVFSSIMGMFGGKGGAGLGGAASALGGAGGAMGGLGAAGGASPVGIATAAIGIGAGIFSTVSGFLKSRKRKKEQERQKKIQKRIEKFQKAMQDIQDRISQSIDDMDDDLKVINRALGKIDTSKSIFNIQKAIGKSYEAIARIQKTIGVKAGQAITTTTQAIQGEAQTNVVSFLDRFKKNATAVAGSNVLPFMKKEDNSTSIYGQTLADIQKVATAQKESIAQQSTGLYAEIAAIQAETAADVAYLKKKGKEGKAAAKDVEKEGKKAVKDLEEKIEDLENESQDWLDKIEEFITKQKEMVENFNFQYEQVLESQKWGDWAGDVTKQIQDFAVQFDEMVRSGFDPAQVVTVMQYQKAQLSKSVKESIQQRFDDFAQKVLSLDEELLGVLSEGRITGATKKTTQDKLADIAKRRDELYKQRDEDLAAGMGTFGSSITDATSAVEYFTDMLNRKMDEMLTNVEQGKERLDTVSVVINDPRAIAAEVRRQSNIAPYLVGAAA